jgi:hypothetical protein
MQCVSRGGNASAKERIISPPSRVKCNFITNLETGNNVTDLNKQIYGG